MPVCARCSPPTQPNRNSLPVTLHLSIPASPCQAAFPAPGPRLRDAIEQGQQAGRGLLLVLTPPDHGLLFAAHMSLFGPVYINLSLELARRLLDVPRSERAAQAAWQLPLLLPDSQHAVAIGHPGLLFLPSR